MKCIFLARGIEKLSAPAKLGNTASQLVPILLLQRGFGGRFYIFLTVFRTERSRGKYRPSLVRIYDPAWIYDSTSIVTDVQVLRRFSFENFKYNEIVILITKLIHFMDEIF